MFRSFKREKRGTNVPSQPNVPPMPKEQETGKKKMTLDETIHREEALAYSFGERYKRLGEPVGDLQELEAEHRQMAEWLRELQRDREILNGLSLYFQSLVCDSIINNRPLMFDMRDATKKERESVKRFIADSVETTGVNFWSIIGEVNADDEKGSDSGK